MTTFLLIAIIVLAVLMFGVLIYLWWLPVKIKKIANEAVEENNAIEFGETSENEEVDEDE